MPELCIRYHIHGMEDCDKVKTYLKSIATKWFYSRHDTELPHYHWYIETSKKDQQVRTQISKMRNPELVGKKADRVYSVSELREELWKYMSYVRMKPESSNVDDEDSGHFDDILRMSVEYAASQKKKTEKKAVNWFQEVLDNCHYDFSDKETSFNNMYDFLVDRKYVNQFTEIKLRQMFYMWAAVKEKEGNPDEYKKQRKRYFMAIL